MDLVEELEVKSDIDTEGDRIDRLKRFLSSVLGIANFNELAISKVESIQHVFSHIKKTYIVYRLVYGGADEQNKTTYNERPMQWIFPTDIDSIALSTAMKKVWRAANQVQKTKSTSKRKVGDEEQSQNTTLLNFFAKKTKAS